MVKVWVHFKVYNQYPPPEDGSEGWSTYNVHLYPYVPGAKKLFRPAMWKGRTGHLKRYRKKETAVKFWTRFAEKQGIEWEELE